MVYEKLLKVQGELKAPKSLYNSFGKYYYRNAESILEAFKPIGQKLGLVLMLEDSISDVGGKNYIMTTATLYDTEDGSSIRVSAYAREPLSKKGMDECQLTGATSSYARKYCLNGLFLLDDTKDADTDEYRNESDARAKKQISNNSQRPTEAQIQTLTNLIHKKGETVEDMLKRVGVSSMQELTPKSYNSIVQFLKDV